tara:strand:- start:136 stop:348 length:213 start_codon:yes stop_codon:yes gene_type:complete
MTQEVKVAYKDSDKSVVGFIGAEVDTSIEIEPTLAKDGKKVASEVLSFADDVNITKAMVTVSSSGVASKV